MTERRSLIALTGATGFLGSHIADLLLARGHAVRASVRATSDQRWVRGKGIELVEIDIGSPSAARRFVDGAAAVIHCAGVVTARNEEHYHTGNVATTACLLQATADAASVTATAASGPRPATFVFISSLAAAGPGSLADPRREDRPCEPISAYGRSKRAAEQMVCDKPWPMRCVALRPPALYGPRDAAFLPLFKAAARGWTARFGNSLAGLSMVHGQDAAAAAVALMDAAAATGIYFVDDGPRKNTAESGAESNSGSGTDRGSVRRHRWGYEYDELRLTLEQIFARRVRTLSVPLGLLRLVSRLIGPQLAVRSPVTNPDRLRDLAVVGWVCSGEKLQRETDFAPKFDLSGGFADTLAYYQRNGWLR